MRSFIIISLILCINSWNSHSQAVSTGESNLNIPEFAPMEDIFIHFNSSLLFAGEYLYYSIYCLNKNTSQLSPLSKIAYVELIAKDHEQVFRHKIKLMDGLGRGDFFIPTSVPTGNYKLIGYTNWMNNRKNSPYFSADVVVINPYNNQMDQKITTDDAEENFSSIKVSEAGDISTHEIETSSNSLQLNLNGSKFGSRQRVAVNFQSLSDTLSKTLPGGNFSISVRKKDKVDKPRIPTAGSYSKKLSRMEDTWAEKEEIHLPEFRGEIISGNLSRKGDTGDYDFSDVKVALSIPGKNFLLKIARPDEDGNFYFVVDSDISSDQAFFQVLGKSQEMFNINVNPPASVNYSQMKFHNFQVTPEMEEMIIERSVYNQIENGYFTVKPDTIPVEKLNLPFYGTRIEVYNLDDYTRFETLQQTLIEFIKFARLITNNNGENIFAIRGFDKEINADSPALLLIDGILVQDHSIALSLEAEEIQSIGVVRDRYFLGPEVFQGILEINTKSMDFDPALWENQIQTTRIQQPQQEKRYFQQKYNLPDNSLARIPDLRYQLLWEPNFVLTPQNSRLEFYTSDVPGMYEISLEGFSSKGEPVSIRETFTVE